MLSGSVAAGAGFRIVVTPAARAICKPRSVADLALCYDLLQGPDADDPACAQRSIAPTAELLDRGAAGWRMDVAPWVPDDFWREWRQAVKQTRPDAITIAETWFDAQDALDAGLATRMAEPVRIAASFDIGRFRNAPMALAEMGVGVHVLGHPLVLRSVSGQGSCFSIGLPLAGGDPAADRGR